MTCCKILEKFLPWADFSKSALQIIFKNYGLILIYNVSKRNLCLKKHREGQGWGKNPGNLKNPWEWEKLVFTGKNCLFQNTCLKSILNHWQINDGMF